jgi:hypothetical protein
MRQVHRGAGVLEMLTGLGHPHDHRAASVQIDTHDLLAAIIVHRGLLRHGGRSNPSEHRYQGDCHAEARPRLFIASGFFLPSPLRASICISPPHVMRRRGGATTVNFKSPTLSEVKQKVGSRDQRWAVQCRIDQLAQRQQPRLQIV